MTFIDFTGVFDSVDSCTIWKTCSSPGLGQVMINLFEALYDETYCKTKAFDTSSPFQVTTGVRHGSVLSSLLTVIIID